VGRRYDMSKESKGFTIKCNECGRETTFTHFEQTNYDIAIASDYDGDITLDCDCHNRVLGV
jgi:hypothetical protein